MGTVATRKAWREYLAMVAIVLVLTFLIGLVRSKSVSKEMIWDWLASSAALSLGICTGRAIMRRYG